MSALSLTDIISYLYLQSTAAQKGQKEYINVRLGVSKDV